MARIKITNYVFVKGISTVGTVTFTDYKTTGIRKEAILAILNTTRNVFIYNPTDATLKGTVSGNVLTLQFDTSAQNNADNLQIFYEQDLFASYTPYLTQRVTGEPNALFADPFDGGAVDTTNRWNAPVVSGGTVTQSSGNLVIAPTTTASNYATIRTQPTFVHSGLNFLVFGCTVQLEATIIVTGTYRFWGLGTNGGTFSSTNPVANGVGFEVTTGGVLQAVVYSNNASIYTSALTVPIDGIPHRYALILRSDLVSWYVDNIENPVVSTLYSIPQIQTLPLSFIQVNGGSLLGATPTFNVGALGLGDSGPNNVQISDGALPWRKATVSSGGALLVSAPGIPTALGQQAAAASQPVTLSNENVQDLPFIGQAAQTAIVNNIIPAAVSANATDLTGYRSACVQIICPAGTYTTGAIIFEGANDSASGTNFQPIPTIRQDTGALIPAAAITLVTTTSIGYIFPVTFRYIRVRISTAVTGASASVQAISLFKQVPFAMPFVSQPTGANLAVNISSGTISTVNAVVAGTGATNLGKAEDAVAANGDTIVAIGTLRNDALTNNTSASGDYQVPTGNKYGALYVQQYEKNAKTYSASANLAPAAAATDIFTITGNGTTNVYITKVIVSGSQTTFGLVDTQLIKRSTADTLGTSSGVTATPHDSGDAAASATLLAYTANPTTGTPVGTPIRRGYIPYASLTSTLNPTVVFEFGDKGKPITLIGTSQVLAVNLNGATLTGGAVSVSIEWFEL